MHMNEYVNRKGIRGNISHHHHRRQIDFIVVVVIIAPTAAAAVDVYTHIACCLESAKKKIKMCRFYTHALATHTNVCVCV